jgi:signal transduction histidine kinase
MRGRPWPGALGLRGRIVGVVLVTAVATLAVAAIALLGPLQSRLRSAELTTLEKEVTRASTRPFKANDISHALKRSVHDALQARERDLGAPIGAPEVALLGYPEPSGKARTVVALDPDLANADPNDDAAAAFRDGKPRYTFGSIDGDHYARAAIPFTTRSEVPNQPWRWVLVVRKPLAEVSSAVSAVRTAFLVAALVALGLTLILGIPLSATIVRRLRRLRQAALRLAQGGPPVHVPVDRARDEVGDLARTFSLMQHQLQRQEEARRAFVATASHELRTPLATLDGMLELLREDLRSGDPDLDDAQSLLERARAQSKRLGRLAADLLDLSRIDARVELRSEPVELGELSRAVLAEFDLGTAECGIVTVLDDSSGSVWALGDPGSVARILRILLDNAIRLSPDGGEVKVELRNGSNASLSVCDRGPGIPPEERGLIFERFMRGRDTTRQAGFGLGLAIGRELAERMGGELVLEEHDGPGARFTLRLPVAHAPEEEPIAVA